MAQLGVDPIKEEEVEEEPPEITYSREEVLKLTSNLNYGLGDTDKSF